jgi:uncharacterized protein YjdB
MNSVPTEEETIRVGGQLRLTAATLRATGDPVDPQPTARWSSTDPSVATVDASGVVTGVKVGSTLRWPSPWARCAPWPGSRR